MTEKEITDFVAWAMGLSTAPFTVLATLAFGYVLRLIPKFPNGWIPITVITFATVAFPILAKHHVDDTTFQYMARTVFMGMIIGLGTIGLHERFISKFEDKIPLLGKLLSASEDKADSNKPTTGP